MPGGDAVRARESLLNIRFLSAAVAASAGLSAPHVFADTHGKTMVVTATRVESRADALLNDVTVIDREQIESAGASSVVELLSRQPGIQHTQAGGIGKNASVFIRGANFGHVLLLIDGVRTGSATLGEANLASLPLEQIERIEILRGPASALYGADAVGGVIQIFTRQAAGVAFAPTAFAGVGSDGLRRGGVGFSGRTEAWRYQFSAGYLETDGFSARRREVADPDRDGYRETSVSGGLTWTVADGHELGAQLIYTNGRNWFDSEFDPTPANLYLDSEVSTIALFSKNRMNDTWHSTVRYGRSTDSSYNVYSIFYDPSHFRTINEQLTWQNDLSLSHGTLMLAVEHLRQSVEASNDYQQTDRELRSLLAGWNGSYGIHSVQINLRRDDSSAFDDRTTGFAAYGLQITEQLRAHVSYGTSYVAPTFNDLYWPNQTSSFAGTTYITEGNAAVKPEEGHNREVALIWDDGRSVLSATWYLNKVRNLIDWETTQTGPTTFLTKPSNVASARLEGLTLSAATRWGETDLSASVDFLKARDEDTEQRLQRRADRTASLRVEHPVGPARVGAELYASDGRYSRSNEVDRLPGYAVVNLFGRYALAPQWTIEARVDNVFDQDYELIKDFNTGGVTAYLGVRYAPR